LRHAAAEATIARPARVAEPDGGFVGRERELEELRAGLGEALSGRGQLLLLAGEPGIGKTALADELAGTARGAGAAVLRGGCFEGGGAPPYWPWLQVLRALPAGRARAPIDVPSLRPPGSALGIEELLPTPPPACFSDPEEARFHLFDSVAALLREHAAETPLVVLIDDLQWADESSLLLLAFLARNLRNARVLAVAAYRDVEARLSPAVGKRIADLACDARTIRLGGLSAAEVALLVERWTGARPGDDLVAAIGRATDGNPLFVTEILRDLANDARLASRDAAALPLPDRVRALIARRMEQLSRSCRHVLAVAAVLGREFDLATLTRVAAGDGPDRGVPLDALDEAARAHVVRASGGATFSFVHDLFREAFYEHLGPAESARLHARVGEVLEPTLGGMLDARLPELARHFFLAGPAQAERAVRYSLRAAARAAASFAHAEAVEHYRRALAALATSGGETSVKRCRILLALGDGLWSTGGFDEARDVYERAADVAEGAGRGEELARAALGFGGQDVSFDGGVVEPRLIRLLERGLAAIGPEDGVLRASLMARLAAALAYSDQRGRGAMLARAAVAMARRLGHEPTLHFALNCFLAAVWGPDDFEERLAVCRETTRLAAGLGGAGAAEFHGGLMTLLLEAGDAAAAEREAQAYRRRTEVYGRRISTWILAVRRAMIALLEGRFAEVEALATHALRLGSERQNGNAVQYYGAQMLVLRREQGRLDEMVDAVAGFAVQYPAVPAWRAALAWIYAELGRDVEAQRELDRLAVDDFAELPRDMLWLLSLWLCAEVATKLGDARRAAILYAVLVPFAGRCVTSGSAFCGGSMQRTLGMLAGVLGRYEAAERHFTAAALVHERIGGKAWIAYGELDRARMLLARGAAGDRAEALACLRRAAESARALDMPSLLARAESALHDLAPPGALAADDAVFRLKGEWWTLEYRGATARLRDARGLRLIALLLAAPGRELRASELAAWPAPAAAEAAVARGAVAEAGLGVGPLGGAAAGPDARARAAYRARLADLREEAEEAERCNDPLRAARAREEIRLLAEEVAASRSGRRHWTADGERARLSVTKAIRYAIRKVERAHPELGAVLAAGVKTGTTCRYEPDASAPVRWIL
jgi:tetratricopeptide (TPR) repeat protein